MGYSIAKPCARLTRCCSPPEKVAGGSDHRLSGRFSRASSVRARRSACASATPEASIGSLTISSVGTRGITRRNWLT